MNAFLISIRQSGRLVLAMLSVCLLACPLEGMAADNAENTDSIAQQATKQMDWVSLESGGTLQSTAEGALPKTMWKGQNRSDIIFLLKRLPVNSPLPAVNNLKKRLLLSRNDASLIHNDIPPQPGYDLLTLRLDKLMDMGLYGDALNLYTQSVEDPYHDRLAQIGILLMIFHGDISTACLEEKVLAVRWPESGFWTQMDKVCNIKLGTQPDSPPQFENSPVLQAIFYNPEYNIPVLDMKAFEALSMLEKAIAIQEGKIDYSGLEQAPEDVTKLPPLLLKGALQSGKNSPPVAGIIKTEAVYRGLIKAENLANHQEIMNAPKGPEQWVLLERALSTTPSSALLRPYSSLIRESEPESVPQDIMLSALAVMLMDGEKIPAFWVRTAESLAEANPENYLYLQALDAAEALDAKINIPVEKLEQALHSLHLNKAEQLIAITSILDKEINFYDNPRTIYEKHLRLTLNGYYVMPSVGLIKWLKDTESHNNSGLLLLIILNALHEGGQDIYPDITSEVLESLLNVGLIEEAHLFAKAIISSLLIEQKGE